MGNNRVQTEFPVVYLPVDTQLPVPCRQYFELITHNAAKLRIFLENAVDGGAAAAHGGVDGAFVVEGLLEAGEGGVSGEDGAFEVVEDTVLPFFDREGVQEVAQAAARGPKGRG